MHLLILWFYPGICPGEGIAGSYGESESEVAQSCPTLCDPMDCSLSGSSIHGIFQARVLEWIAISFSRGSSRPRNWTRVSSIAGRRFMVGAIREALCLFFKEPQDWFPTEAVPVYVPTNRARGFFFKHLFQCRRFSFFLNQTLRSRPFFPSTGAGSLPPHVTFKADWEILQINPSLSSSLRRVICRGLGFYFQQKETIWLSRPGLLFLFGGPRKGLLLCVTRGHQPRKNSFWRKPSRRDIVLLSFLTGSLKLFTVLRFWVGVSTSL